MTTQESKRPRRKKVIIVGAGLAGLSCAYELSKSKDTDHEIVILEARNRPGGRVHTLTERFAPGLSAEAGAFWIHQEFRQVNHYLKEFGLEEELERGGDTLPYYVKGKRFDDVFNTKEGLPGMKSHEVKLGLGGLFGMCLCPEFSNPSPASSGWPPTDLLKKYGKMKFIDFMRGRQLPISQPPIPITEEAIDFMRPWFNWWDDLNEMSALAVIRDGIISRLMCGKPQWSTLKHGMKQIPMKFEQSLTKAKNKGKRIDIRYQAPVVGISRNSTTVTASYLLTSGQKAEERGDYLVCTIPFSTLRDIKQLPDDFSQEKKKAIATLRYVPVARIYLQYKKPFGLLKHGGVGLTDRPFGNLLDMTMVQTGTKEGRTISNRGRIIQAYMVGEQARAVSSMNENERRAFLKKQLEATFTDPEDGIVGNEIEASDSICWHDEQWSKGAYPCFTPEEFTSFKLEDIAKPEGRVHFAGDHTSAYPGWMEGALQSGQRTANEIAVRA